MQKGFATIEIVFATLTIPNVSRIIDRATLDYETKCLYSELRYLQAISRSEKLNLSGLGINNSNFTSPLPPYMNFIPEKLSYQIKRGNNEPLRPPHYMRVVKFSTSIEKIFFDSAGRAFNGSTNKTLSTTITLTSRYGKSSTIVFDSVGRLRGGREGD